MSTTDIAFRNMSWAVAPKQTAEDRAIQLGIDRTMREVTKVEVGRGIYNPAFREASPTVTVASGVKTSPGLPLSRGTGWQSERELESPLPNGSLAERVVGALCDQALGPAVPKKKEGG
jgi:hypothetical protein